MGLTILPWTTLFCYSDASDVAMGGIIAGCSEGWRYDLEEELRTWHITANEMLALHVNVQKCIDIARGAPVRIVAFVDNLAVQEIACRGRALTDSMEWLWAPIRRKLHHANAWLTVSWISTENNKVADLLSRQDNQEAITASQTPLPERRGTMYEAPQPEWAPHMNHTHWATPPPPFGISSVNDARDEVREIGAMLSTVMYMGCCSCG